MGSYQEVLGYSEQGQENQGQEDEGYQFISYQPDGCYFDYGFRYLLLYEHDYCYLIGSSFGLPFFYLYQGLVVGEEVDP